MAYAPTKLGQDPKYEPFLQAPVGDDHRGTSVTVLSMFARLGVDPWCEASDLASLPDGAARQRLEALMARFHDVSTQVADRGSIISRLLAFLPRQGKSVIPSSDSVSSTLAVPPQGSRFYWIVAAAFFLGWIIMLAQGQ